MGSWPTRRSSSTSGFGASSPKALTQRVVIGAGVVGLATALALQRPRGNGHPSSTAWRRARGQVVATQASLPRARCTRSLCPACSPAFRACYSIPGAPYTYAPAFCLSSSRGYCAFWRRLDPPGRGRFRGNQCPLQARPSLWDGLLQKVGLAVPLTRKGLLYAYGSPRSFAAALRDNVYRTRRGIAFEILDGAAACALEPAPCTEPRRGDLRAGGGASLASDAV